jgi:hypothetical protein
MTNDNGFDLHLVRSPRSLLAMSGEAEPGARTNQKVLAKGSSRPRISQNRGGRPAIEKSFA